MKLFYRIHWDDPSTFSAENTNSRPWGEEGEGQTGYSCCESPADLEHYFDSRGGLPDDNEKCVVEFSGTIVGYDMDNQPRVIPDMRYVRWMTVRELLVSMTP